MLDSRTFEDLLDHNDRLVSAILAQRDSTLLEFTRSPSPQSHEETKAIRAIELVWQDSEVRGIEIRSTRGIEAQIHFGYRMQDVMAIAKEVFVQRVLNGLRESDLFITNNKLLLSRRGWLETHFPGGPLNIVSVDEASMYIDHFFKKNGHYFLNPGMRLDGSWYWYWLSMRLKLPHYNVGDLMLDAMANRFRYSLMALDQIAVQYYSGPNNDSLDMTLYHFDHLIALITGIFDNLALKTDSELGINLMEVDVRKISLSNVIGDDFLREIRSKRPELRDHISAYMNFIMLVYSFREVVIHREGLSKTSFEYRGEDARWRANVVKLDEKQLKRMEECRRWGEESKWGVFMGFLEPYLFSTTGLTVLKDFVDKYLELLGQVSYIEAIRRSKDEPLTKDLDDLEKYRLGF